MQSSYLIAHSYTFHICVWYFTPVNVFRPLIYKPEGKRIRIIIQQMNILRLSNLHCRYRVNFRRIVFTGFLISVYPVLLYGHSTDIWTRHIEVTKILAYKCEWLPLPWASVHWLVQCTLECHWLTQCTMGYHWACQRILAGYTGTPLERLSWNSPTLECHWRNLVESAPHWDATGETQTFAAYTGRPLGGLWQPTHAPTHIVKHAE